jgi:hypothetical protein
MNLYIGDVFERPTFKEGYQWSENMVFHNKPSLSDKTTLNIQVDKAWHNLSVDVNRTKTDQVEFWLSSINNNCGLIMLSGLDYYVWDSEIDEWENPEDVSEMDVDFMFGTAINLSKDMGYSQILYTVSNKQGELIDALVKKGFKLLEGSEVRNKRSGNDISMYVYNI